MFQNLLWVYGMAWMTMRFHGLKFCPSPPLTVSDTVFASLHTALMLFLVISDWQRPRLHLIASFLDLSAAFDTIDHDILLDRLQNYTGIQGQALRCFRSYMSNHYHFVYLQGSISIITSKVWSTTRICNRSSAIFNIHVAPW